MSVSKEQPDAVEAVDLHGLGYNVDGDSVVSVTVESGRTTRVTLDGPASEWIVESGRDRVLERDRDTGGLFPRPADELPAWACAVLQHCGLDQEVR